MSKNKRTKSGFTIGTTAGLGLLLFIGIMLLIFAYAICKPNTIPQEILKFLGETFISAAIISVILELHSIQDNYKKVRDYLLLEEPSFIEKYNEEEVDRIIELGIKQKIRLKSIRKLDNEAFNRLTAGKAFPLQPYIEHTANELGANGFYCTSHRRQVNITPVSNQEYKIKVTLEMELYNFTKETIDFQQKYQFYYISKKQTDTFSINYLKVNQVSETLAEETLKKYENDTPSTSKHPFNYMVEFYVPIHIDALSDTKYVLEYEYTNYEQSCFITYSLPYITESFQETYSLVGENAHDYQLHASAYTPYKREIDSHNMVQRANETTLTINWDKWIEPGSGFVAVVRKKL